MVLVMRAYPEEFRRDAIAIAITRKGEAPVRQVGKNFGVSEMCLQRLLRIADRGGGVSGPKSVANGGRLPSCVSRGSGSG